MYQSKLQASRTIKTIGNNMSKGGNANDQTLVKIIWLNLYFAVNLFFRCLIGMISRRELLLMKVKVKMSIMSLYVDGEPSFSLISMNMAPCCVLASPSAANTFMMKSR